MANQYQHVQFISAGAGSGKTYTLTKQLDELLLSSAVQPAGIIAATFTKLAAGELQERVRSRLIESGHVDTANAMGQAMIGTVNGVCGELLQRFAFEAGMSPDQRVLEGEEGQQLFREALEKAIVCEEGLLQKMNALSLKFDLMDKQSNLIWRSEVKAIVDAARSNNITSNQLDVFAKQSADSLLAQFPKPVEKNMDKDLHEALQKAITSIRANINSGTDATKITEKYIGILQDLMHKLEQGRISWSNWIKLSKENPGKKSETFAQDVQTIAGMYGQHSGFHEDVRSLCNAMFLIAGKSLDEYQKLKIRLGLVDFVDQESQLYALLDDPTVQEVLRAELQLLMVDEFQDTSPIQLALFLKLSQFAKKVIWVGDIKQSIYGFRGSDPDLMQAVIHAIGEQGIKPHILNQSWRSRPGLVDYVNAIFVPAFSSRLSENQVALTSARKGDDTASIVEQWVLEGIVENGKTKNNKETRANALAAGIDTMVNSDKRMIEDKASKSLRQINYGDIAVLCRTNDNLAEIAQALTRQKIPVNYQRTGLLDTAEVTLAMACLRRLADAQDTLASAEIRFLTYLENPETWLTDRLQYIQADQSSSKWGEQTIGSSKAIPELEALAKLRGRLVYFTPVEAFEQAILAANVRKTVCQWSGSTFQASQRLRNLDALLVYAQQYVDHCDTQRLAATVPGLILWLHDLNEEEQDWQAQPDGNAVQLCTHHGAKGLEWPVVIAMDLDSEIKNRLWGLTVKPNPKGFTLDNPLKDRSLNYWPAFFGGQSAGIQLKDDIEQSPIGVTASKSAIEETKRLLYVSLTRARDLLILPFAVKKNTGDVWLESLSAGWMLPEDKALKLPDGKTIVTDKKVYQQVSVDQNPNPNIFWMSVSESVIDSSLPARLQPSSMNQILDARIGESVKFSDRLNLASKTDITQLGKALHAVIASRFIGGDSSDATTQRILADYKLVDNVKVSDAVDMANEFIAFIQKKFSPVAVYAEYPVQYYNANRQRVAGWIDLLLETDKGWILIDHKASPQKQANWNEIALGYSGQLALYIEAIEKASGKPVIQSWIHFAVAGACVEVCLPH